MFFFFWKFVKNQISIWLSQMKRQSLWNPSSNIKCYLLKTNVVFPLMIFPHLVAVISNAFGFEFACLTLGVKKKRFSNVKWTVAKRLAKSFAIVTQEVRIVSLVIHTHLNLVFDTPPTPLHLFHASAFVCFFCWKTAAVHLGYDYSLHRLPCLEQLGTYLSKLLSPHLKWQKVFWTKIYY